MLTFNTICLIFSGNFVLGLVQTNNEFHLSISPDERHAIFGSYDLNVPDYELVQIGHSITKREIYLNKNISLNAFGNVLKLTIQRRMPIFSTDTPIWIASGIEDTNDVTFTRLDENMLTDAVQFYEDPENMAGIGIIKDKFGTLHFIIHHQRENITVQKVPAALHEKWQEFFQKSKNSRVKRSTEVPFLENHYIIIKRSAMSNDDDAKKFKIDISALPPYHGPEKISPGILVVANYRTHYGSVMELRFYQLLVYLVCFWNAVNSKFVHFNKPKIDFHIAGIIVGNNEYASPYYRPSYRSNRSNTQPLLTAMDALHDFVDYIMKFDKVYNDWDIAISQSDMSMVGTCDGKPCSLEGVAFLNKSCIQGQNSQYLKTGVIHDRFDFHGIKIAAHEIGHILGAKHDGAKTSQCDDGGFLMAPTNGEFFGENSNFWSSCSINEIMRELRRNNQASCWRTRPSILSDALPEIFPGYIVNVTNQCRTRGYASSCNEESITCEKLFCRRDNKKNNDDDHSQKGWWRREVLDLILYSWWNDCEDAGVPHSGTLCGINKHCINNKCVDII